MPEKSVVAIHTRSHSVSNMKLYRDFYAKDSSNILNVALGEFSKEGTFLSASEGYAMHVKLIMQLGTTEVFWLNVLKIYD